MSYPKQFLDEIRDRVPISEVIGKRVPIRRAGREFKACCPFHKEKSPSFTINDEKGFYHCFGCGVHGDVIEFLIEHDRLSFPEAIEFLAMQAGLEVPQQTEQQKNWVEKSNRGYDLLEAAAKFFETHLQNPKNSQCLSYMLERGISQNTLKKFRVGYAPKSYDEMINTLKSQGFTLVEMEKFGLAKPSTRGGDSYYTFFRDRVIFPVTDKKGRVVAFGGRILPHSYGGPHPDMDRIPPKYLNSPDHELFHKGTMLYGAMAEVRKAASDGQRLVIVEGYMDVVALAEFGYKAVVAPLGTALTEMQVEESWRMLFNDGLKAPILCFDGDKAGRRAALRAMERSMAILKPDYSVHFAFLPEGHDPDTLVREKGLSSFVNLLDKSANLFSVLWNEESKKRDLNSPEAMAGLKKSLIDKARLIADKTVQDLFIRQIDKRFQDVFYGNNSNNRKFSFTQKKQKFNRVEYRARKDAERDAHRPQINPIKQRPSATQVRERILLVTLLNYPELFDEFGEIFGMLPVHVAGFDSLRCDMIDIFTSNPDIKSKDICAELEAKGHIENLRKLLQDDIYMHAGFAKPGQHIDDVRKGWQDTLSYSLERRK